MGQVVALIIPYKTFKERVRLIKQYERNYYIENMGSYLYLVRR